LCPVAKIGYVWDLMPPVTLTAVAILIAVGVYKIWDA
jgi:hypothetical protein